MPNQTKICPRCKQEKPATPEFFYRQRTYLYYICKTCHKGAVRKSRWTDIEKSRARERAGNQKIRMLVLERYGGSPPKCACCGEGRIEFLSLDHTNGGGLKHRREVGGGAYVWRWCKKNNFPEGFRVLCHNCNLSLGFYKRCPHQESNLEVIQWPISP